MRGSGESMIIGEIYKMQMSCSFELVCLDDFLRLHVGHPDRGGLLGPGLQDHFRAGVGQDEEESAGEAVHEVAHLHHIPQAGVLHAGDRRDHPLRHSVHAYLQNVPLPARKRSTSLPSQISHEIYKRIQKHLERVRLDEYNSHFGIALSFLCTHTVAILMKLICKIAAFIDSKHIEEVEKHILDIIKTL
jgi:hypothetical protein